MSAYLMNIDGAEALLEAQQAIREGAWPEEHLAALTAPIEELAGQGVVGFHHVGYTYPDRESFDAAVAGTPGELLANDMVANGTLHHRRYLRVPRTDGPDTFIEHHLPGNGNGITGVHLDFTFLDAATMLDRVQSRVSGLSGVEVVTQPFPGGFAPVGKVALRPLGVARETGIMVRTSWTDPTEW